MRVRQVSYLFCYLGLLVLMGFQMPLAMAAENRCPESAHQYWNAFRSATIRNNTSEIADMTRFPFELRGTLDDSDTRQILRKEFIRTFPAMLKTDPGLAPVPSTMKSLVKATRRLSPSFCNPYGNQFRVGTWVFASMPEGWRFVQAFIDD